MNSSESKGDQQASNNSPIIPEGVFDPIMFDLFCVEIETQCKILNQGLIEIERTPKDRKLFDSLMRAAHSIKGAARVLNLNPIVHLVHMMEDCFTLIQHQESEMPVEKIDQLLRSVDFLSRLSKTSLKEVNSWLSSQLPFIDSLIEELSTTAPKEVSTSIFQKQVRKITKPLGVEIPIPLEIKSKEEPTTPPKIQKELQSSEGHERVLRITAENLNRLMGLAGESLIESRWLYPFGENLQEFKNQLMAVQDVFDLLKDNIHKGNLNQITQHCLTDLHNQLHALHLRLNERLVELDYFIRRHANLSDRLYQEVINSRMRPFADGVEAFPRMVRDLARQLGKQVRLEIEGKATPVDREILEKLESPLSHLLRNAVDHGIESPNERLKVGKPIEGLIRLEAHHRGGMLAITVSDDGKGIDIEQLRRKIIEEKLATPEIASRLTNAEVMDFLFLPGFSTSKNLTEISGRGIGLNIFQSTLQEVGGIVRTQSIPGKGMSFHLQLPLTLSVIRALIVEISGEAYAFPLAQINQAYLVPRENIELIEDRQFFQYEGQNIGLVPAWEVLEFPEPQHLLERLPVIILGERMNSYGLVVDRFIGEKELVVQELDSRLGKIPDISSGALMEDGSLVLIIDVEDIIRSIDYLLSGGRLMKIAYAKEVTIAMPKKRILVVDDSITVREVECRLLQNQGYEVETAVNGIDGLNAVRLGLYDLVITDIDMPRMNGIEFLRAIKSDPKLQKIPVMIVSYKEWQEDRFKGLEAGAEYYLTKSSFHDASLIDAVKELIGEP